MGSSFIQFSNTTLEQNYIHYTLNTSLCHCTYKYNNLLVFICNNKWTFSLIIENKLIVENKLLRIGRNYLVL